jgi:hypothetical protein
VRLKTVEVVSAPAAFDRDCVVLSDGTRIRADTVISATGYRCDAASLAGHLGVVTPQGAPVRHAPAPSAKGLYFHGLVSRPALIGYVARQSRGLARRICAEVGSSAVRRRRHRMTVWPGERGFSLIAAT